MAEKSVAWTKTAAQQRRMVLKYWIIRNGSTSYSEKLIKKIAEHTYNIAKHPESFRHVNYRNMRISTIGNYSLVYLVKEHQILITAFWDNRQDPEELFKLLKNEK